MGVFPCTRRSLTVSSSLPYARGGVSDGAAYDGFGAESSPRLWGCFSVGDRRERARLVFPTPVGVFLIGVSPTFILLGLPHACGGVSVQCSATLFRPQSSPRLWGCFRQGWRLPRNWWVFPTPVGVFPTARARCTPARRLPHACGGVSVRVGLIFERQLSSPRLWGCFPAARSPMTMTTVFPTPVGVFLPLAAVHRIPARLPQAGLVLTRLPLQPHIAIPVGIRQARDHRPADTVEDDRSG